MQVTLTITMTRPSVDIPYFNPQETTAPEFLAWKEWTEANTTSNITHPDDLTQVITITMSANDWPQYVSLAGSIKHLDTYAEDTGITMMLNPVWHD